MRRRKVHKREKRVKRAWEERQYNWMRFSVRNRRRILFAIIIIAITIFLIPWIYYANNIYRHYVADVEELENQIDFLEIRFDEIEEFSIHISPSNSLVTLEIYVYELDEDSITYTTANNALQLIYMFSICFVVADIIIGLIICVPIYYVYCFVIFLFTEVMSRLQKRRKP